MISNLVESKVSSRELSCSASSAAGGEATAFATDLLVDAETNTRPLERVEGERTRPPPTDLPAGGGDGTTLAAARTMDCIVSSSCSSS